MLDRGRWPLLALHHNHTELAVSGDVHHGSLGTVHVYQNDSLGSVMPLTLGSQISPTGCKIPFPLADSFYDRASSSTIVL